MPVRDAAHRRAAAGRRRPGRRSTCCAACRGMAFAGRHDASSPAARSTRGTPRPTSAGSAAAGGLGRRRSRADEALARALLCAAVRETFEESGVLLAGPSAGRGLRDRRRRSGRPTGSALERRDFSLAELLARRGLVLRADLLGPWAHWITPAEELAAGTTPASSSPRCRPGQRTRDVTGEADMRRSGSGRPTRWTSCAAVSGRCCRRRSSRWRRSPTYASVADVLAAGRTGSPARIQPALSRWWTARRRGDPAERAGPAGSGRCGDATRRTGRLRPVTPYAAVAAGPQPVPDDAGRHQHLGAARRRRGGLPGGRPRAGRPGAPGRGGRRRAGRGDPAHPRPPGPRRGRRGAARS